MSRRLRAWLGVILFAAAIAATRLPLTPRQLYSFDDVNFAWAVGKFDIRHSQPHPPGYPLFVLQMRVLDALRFKRAESKLVVLALLGSLAAVLLAHRLGNLFFEGDAGLCGALLLLFYPAFWYAGLTSAVRIQLAVVSVAVAAACWRAWRGERRWLFWSAGVLGVGAGIRPELGLLLLPLWAASVFRAKAGRRHGLLGLAVLAAAVLAWLAPLMMLSGGAKDYFALCWKYLRDQAALTSPLFGAGEAMWRTTVSRLLVWTFVGLPAWLLPLALVWRGGRAAVLSREQWLFLAVWFLPSLAFALLVHVADAGQTLAMSPVVCLVGGRLMSRALDEVEARASRWHGLIWMLTVAALWLAFSLATASQTVLLIAVIALAAGWAMRLGPRGSPPPRGHGLVFLLVPALFLHGLVFLHRGWYHAAGTSGGVAGVVHRWLEDLHSGLAFISLDQVRLTASLDDRTLRAVDQLTRKHPRLAVILWERGLTSWRKVAYYYHYLPLVVLDRKTLAGPAPAVATIWRGSRLEQRVEGSTPLPIALPRGGRLIWLLNPKSDLPPRLREHFVLAEMDTVYFCDLPEAGGSRQVGDFLLLW